MSLGCRLYVYQSDYTDYLEGWDLGKLLKIMVPRGGIEPPTRGFSIRCTLVVSSLSLLEMLVL
jgi:hypothetical protein